MRSIAEPQIAQSLPPRRSATLALTVDSTARAYDLSTLALGGKTPEAAGSYAHEVAIWVQAEAQDVYIQFSDTNAATLSDTATIAAGGALAFANTYGGIIKAGNAPIRIRLNRALDKFLVVKAASTSGVLRLWAGSEST